LRKDSDGQIQRQALLNQIQTTEEEDTDDSKSDEESKRAKKR
jgi:hypothetical protein